MAFALHRPRRAAAERRAALGAARQAHRARRDARRTPKLAASAALRAAHRRAGATRAGAPARRRRRRRAVSLRRVARHGLSRFSSRRPSSTVQGPAAWCRAFFFLSEPQWGTAVYDRRLFTSESVTEGHPDKVADADLRRGARRHPRRGSRRARRLRDARDDRPRRRSPARSRRRRTSHLPEVVRAHDRAHRLHRRGASASTARPAP